MRYALVTDNIVTNLIDADEAFANTLKGAYDAVVLADNHCGIGWTYLDGTFAEPYIPEQGEYLADQT